MTKYDSADHESACLAPAWRERARPSTNGRFGASSRGSALLLTLALMASSPVFPGSSAATEDSSTGAAADVSTDRQMLIEEQVTVTATGQERILDELPVSVTVFDREIIERSLEESVGDLLRRVPGLTLLRSGGEGSAMSLFVRGTESDHTLALFDGVRLNSPYFGGYDWSLQTTVGLERIEVARGPYSALWGADALGGVVNVIPQRGSNRRNLGFTAEGGNDDWRRLMGAIGFGGSRVDVLASALDFEGRGELENSDFDTRQLLVNAGFTWGDGDRLAVLAQDLDSEIGIPQASPIAPTPNRRQRSEQFLLAVPLSLQTSGGWALEATFSAIERDLFFRDPDDPFGFVSSDTFTETIEARAESHHSLGDQRHDVSWGGEWREDEVSAGSSFGIDLAEVTSSVRAVFVQDVVQLGERWSLIAGARWDDADEWGSEISPRISLGTALTPTFELRASYGEAFRQPSIGELYFPFSGNLDLEPERSQSAELGFDWRLGRQRLDAALFSTDTEQLIDFDFATFAFANIERAEIRGAEASWRAPFASRFESSLSLTWIDAEDQDGLDLLRRPEWSGSWNLSGLLLPRLRGDLTILHVGERPDVDAVTFARTTISSHTTADVALALRVLGSLELTGRVQNLADRRYEEVSGFPAPGRRWMLGVRWAP